MKYFVLTVLRLYDSLEKLEDSLDKTIMGSATSLKGDTHELCCQIMELNDKKRILANIKVICDRIEREIGPIDYVALKKYAEGMSAEELAAQDGVSRSTELRHLNKAVGRCVSLLETLGITERKIVNEYFSLPIVKTVYDYVAARKAPKRNGIDRKRKIRGGESSFSALRVGGGTV